jgi:hypothetical protein
MSVLTATTGVTAQVLGTGISSSTATGRRMWSGVLWLSQFSRAHFGQTLHRQRPHHGGLPRQ